MKLWKIEQFGEGPVGGIIWAETSGEALRAWHSHLEGYEGCYASTGSQRVSLIPDDDPVIYVALRPI